MTTTRISMWSGPRNISTAIMYSFAQRSDTKVLDEPLYGHYLSKVAVQHPGQSDILSEMETDGQKVIDNILLADYNAPVLFMKQMVHHLVHIDESFVDKTHNLLLIRDPYEVLCSYHKVRANATLEDIGIKRQYELHQHLKACNKPSLVIESSYLLQNPEALLKKICTFVGIPFEQNMLSWPKGARTYDGIWAKYWYDNVHQSTGFIPYRKKARILPPHLHTIYEQSKPYYDYLLAQAPTL
mgnify:CR=1 FL=1|jgi:hypothetical protein